MSWFNEVTISYADKRAKTVLVNDDARWVTVNYNNDTVRVVAGERSGVPRQLGPITFGIGGLCARVLAVTDSEVLIQAFVATEMDPANSLPQRAAASAVQATITLTRA